jgi:hypothetical protein
MNQKGQGLLEALVALSAAVIIIAGMTIAAITAVSNSDFAKYQSLATDYAQQGMEIVKQQSQLDWYDTATYSGTLCLPQGATALPPVRVYACSDINVGNMFIRQVDIQNIPPSPSCNNSTSPCCIFGANVDCTKNPQSCSSQVTVTVKWTDGKCSSSSDFCHKVAISSCLQDIYRTQ